MPTYKLTFRPTPSILQDRVNIKWEVVVAHLRALSKIPDKPVEELIINDQGLTVIFKEEK